MSKRPIFVLVLFLIISPLWAQSILSDAVNTAEPRYDMLLSWDEDEYTLRFEVVVEKEEEGRYRQTAQRFTADASIKFSLTQGNYRFRVIPYDLLNKPGKSSEWITFEVHQAFVAELPKTEEPIKEIIKIEEIIEIDKTEETAVKKYRKLYNTYINLSWLPVIPVHTFDENQFFDQTLIINGAGFLLGMVYNQSSYINLGMELSVSWYTFDKDFEYDYLSQNVITFEFDILAQKWFPKRIFALTFRSGAGISFPSSIMSIIVRGDFRDTWYTFNANIGVSLLCLPAKSLYIEAGMKYVYLILSTPSGYFRPSLGIGWRF